jgi:hypothetical protein
MSPCDQQPAGLPRDRTARFVDEIGDGGAVEGMTVVRHPTLADPCPFCGPSCDPDRYLTDQRPSVVLAEHRAEVVTLVVAAGGVNPCPVGAAAAGDDESGDELILAASFAAGLGPVARDALEARLEALLDVGVRITVAQR